MTKALSLLNRSPDAHKGSHGSVGIVGGAAGTVGAAFLSARSALFTGAGRVFVFRPDLSDGYVLDPQTPEVMVLPLDQLDKKPITSWVAGPGLGQSAKALAVLRSLLELHCPLLIDADALTLIANHADLADLCRDRMAETILTPHPGEAARLLATSAKDIQTNRLAAAESLVQRLHATVVLKGHQTVIASPSHTPVSNQTGNPALATAGTGDVLAGFISALLGQGLSAFEAAALGVEIHGSAADSLVKTVGGMIGISASELIPEMRRLLNAWVTQTTGTA
jgi:hydroxyethylthiazole kinase-like uncharacterized protein yjeF